MPIAFSAHTSDRPLYIPGSDFPGFDPPSEDVLGFLALDNDESAVETAEPRERFRVAASAFIGRMNEWYVDQIWIQPRVLDYGNIVGDKTLELDIMSTYRTINRTLLTIDTALLASIGVTRTDTNPVPLVFRPFEQFSLLFEAALLGVADFDADVTFAFDLSESYDIGFEGSRVTVFPFPPQREVVEQLRWRTDIIETRDRTEQRRRLSRTPRQVFRYAPLLRDFVEAATLRNILKGLQGFRFGVPEWHDQRVITAAVSMGSDTIPCSTANADFKVGDTVMIFLPTRAAIVGDVETVNANDLILTTGVAVAVPLGSVVMPLRYGYIVKYPTLSDPLFGAQQTMIEFDVTGNGWEFSDAGMAAAFPTHNLDGLPTLYDHNFVAGDRHQQTHPMEIAIADAQRGLREQFPLESTVRVGHSKIVEITNVTDLWKWRQLVHWLAGSWKSFYMPTFRNDLPLNQSWNIATAGFVSKSVGNVYTGAPALPHRDVLISIDDGRRFVRRVNTIVDNGNGTDTVTLESAPQGGSETLAPSRITISWALLSRIEGDVVTIRHRWPGNATMSFNIRTLL